MYYIVKHGETLSTTADVSTSSREAAKQAAEHLNETTGDHYHVIKVETVWTTKSLAEALLEG
jgi:hypothetical protein